MAKKLAVTASCLDFSAKKALAADRVRECVLGTDGIAMSSEKVNRRIASGELPLKERSLADVPSGSIDGKIHVLLITSANQVHNMMKIAAQCGLAKAVQHGLQQTLVASVGSISTEALLAHGSCIRYGTNPPQDGPTRL